MFLHKIIDEICSVLILELFVSDPHSVQQFLPLWGYVAALKVHHSVTEQLAYTVELTSKAPVLGSKPTWDRCRKSLGALISDFESFPLGLFGRDFFTEPAKGSSPASTVLTGARAMGVALFSSLCLKARVSVLPVIWNPECARMCFVALASLSL